MCQLLRAHGEELVKIGKRGETLHFCAWIPAGISDFGETAIWFPFDFLQRVRELS
jgi:hypothetical protein